MTGKKRRPQGTGGLYQRCDTKRGCPPLIDGHRPDHKCRGLWVGTIEAGYDAKGNRRRLPVTAVNRADAATKLKALQRKVAAGDVPAAGAGSRTTVKAWAEQWLKIHERDVRPDVYVTDRGVVQKWIVPTLGRRRLAELTPQDLRRLTDTITDAGRTATTARNVHGVFVKMLRDARLDGHTIPERIFDAPKPQASASNRTSIPLEQASAILAVVAERTDASRWIYGMLYGVRQGEALGLTWDAVDLDNGTVRVDWQLKQFPEGAKVPTWLRTRHLVGPMWLIEPKTKTRRATLPLLPELGASLAAMRTIVPPNHYNLVWADERGQPIKDAHDRKAWHTIQAEAGAAHPSGRAWHLHECRHTVASILIAAGVDRAYIEAILGHSVLVDAYVHTADPEVRGALEHLPRLLGMGKN